MLDRKEARKADTRLLERREIANVHKFVRRHCRRPCLHYCDTMVDGIYNCGRRSCCRQPFNREALLARFRHMLLNQIHDC
ncbi:hypothetical protein T12_3347 [Trichinella patagoniensis]|uniref:Uncharacterized protein n=1 Tax=Trichinella patagoniensis TaxID=990121 RepID=A0A0V0ZS75_9BILA|nr:hypothetical protein T12_3347 [Trichinella patagoniensis]